MAVASAGPYASLHLTPDRQPRLHPTTQFLQAGCPSCCPTNSVKALKIQRETQQNSWCVAATYSHFFLDSPWVCQQRTVAVLSVLMLFCHTVNNVLTPKDRVCYKNWCKISSLLCSKLFTVNNFFTNMMWCFNCYLQVSLFFLSSPSAAVCL